MLSIEQILFLSILSVNLPLRYTASFLKESIQQANYFYSFFSFLKQITIMELRESICMSQYSYKEHLLYNSKESSIYKAFNKTNPHSHPFVFKGYPESYLTDPLKERKLTQELNSLWELRGKENILQIIAQHSRDRKVFIITQFCQGGSLAEQIKKEGKIGQQKAIAYIQQIIKGYSSIFEARLIHRNLEPSSILNAGLEIKIGDFSDCIKQSDANLATMREQIVGSVLYQPFQVLSSYRYSSKSDVYSIGAILFCMIKGKPPYSGVNKSQILAQMKKGELKDEIGFIWNSKLSEFLKKTLQSDERLRMTPQQLINFNFDMMPQLNRLKFFTFDDRDSIMISQQDGSSPKPSPILQKISEQQRSKEFQESMKGLFKNFDYSSDRKHQEYNLKVSDEYQVSKLYKDRDISIFIPTKIDLPNEESSMMDNLPLEKVESFSKRPSQGLPLKRQVATNKQITNLTYNDLLKSQKLTGTNLKNQTMKNLSTKTEGELVSTNADFLKIKRSNKPRFEENPMFSSITIKDAISNEVIQIPALQFKEENLAKNSKIQQKAINVSSSKPNTGRSEAKGPFTLRGRENIVIEVGKPANQSRNAIIAGWLISQIDMFRYLNRIIFRIKKVSKPQISDLSPSLLALKTHILSNIKGLNSLSAEDKASFQNSGQVNKIKEIVEQYQSKSPQSGQFQSFQKLDKLVITKISVLYNIIAVSSQFKEEEIKLLDYLVTLWQLLKILKRNNLEQFHNKSKIIEIIDSKESKLTIAHLLQIYDRMKLLKLL